MPTLSAKFLNPWTLRSIRRDLLLAWLRPSAGYLESRGLVLPTEIKNGDHLTQPSPPAERVIRQLVLIMTSWRRFFLIQLRRYLSNYSNRCS